MKTYYDLKNEEIKKYKKEFRQTPVGKDMFIGLIFVTILTIIMVLLSHELYEMPIFSWSLFFCAIIIDCFSDIYYNINFTAWLKNKHNIKRW